MAANRTNTVQGCNVEHLFANSVGDHPRAFTAMIKSVGIPQDAVYLNAEVLVGWHRKADVVFHFEEYLRTISEEHLGRRLQLRCSVRSFTGAGYNHIERKRLPEFCSRNQIAKADQDFLETLIKRKSLDPRNTDLVLPRERERVRQIFSSTEVGISALMGNGHPQILTLFSIKRNRFHIYNIAESVEPHIRSSNIGFTPRSSNIKIGEYIIVQRKGSNKEANGRANDIQIKMLVRKFFDEITPTYYYQL